jgi:diguanylate cyclase (GGDEF)-like protein
LLPGVSGYDLVRFVRQDEKYATLPILFLTTQAEAEAQIATARAGGDGHLIKPVLPGLLLSAVAARIERARFLKTLVGRDGLTRLLTHTAFVEQARAVLARKKRDPERSAAWVMIDLDHFKAVNDRYGHPVGDRVLTSLSALLRRRLRQIDTMGRYGGEELAVLLEDLDQDEAMRLVSRLLDEFRLAAHRAPDGSPFHVTFSAGLAMLDPWMDFEWWRRKAEDAMLAAKSQGRARVVMASPSSPPAAAAGG